MNPQKENQCRCKCCHCCHNTKINNHLQKALDIVEKSTAKIEKLIIEKYSITIITTKINCHLLTKLDNSGYSIDVHAENNKIILSIV